MNEKEKNLLNDKALKALCMEYDYCCGEYPESFYEGYSVYGFYLEHYERRVTQDRKDWMKEARRKGTPHVKGEMKEE